MMPDTVAWRNGLTEQQRDEDTSHKGSLSQTSSVPGKTRTLTSVARGPRVSQNILQTTTLKADELYHPDTNL